MAALSTAVMTAGILAAGASMYGARIQTQMAKKQQKAEKQMIAEEQQRATEERKGLLASQRYQMGYDNEYSTSSLGKSITTGESTLG